VEGDPLFVEGQFSGQVAIFLALSLHQHSPLGTLHTGVEVVDDSVLETVGVEGLVLVQIELEVELFSLVAEEGVLGIQGDEIISAGVASQRIDVGGSI